MKSAMREQKHILFSWTFKTCVSRKSLFLITVFLCAVVILLNDKISLVSSTQASWNYKAFFLRGLTEATFWKALPTFNLSLPHLQTTVFKNNLPYDNESYYPVNTSHEEFNPKTLSQNFDKRINRRKMARQKRLQRNITASNDPKWLPLDRNNPDVFVYAAYYDDVDRVPFVRVLVTIFGKAVSFAVKCVYFSQDDFYQPLGVTQAWLSSYGPRGGSRYNGAFAKCPLIKRHHLPFAVSVVKNDDAVIDVTSLNKNVTSVLEVFYGISSLARGRDKVAQEKDEEEKEGNKSRPGWKWNITKCFPCLHRYHNTMQLIQQIEIGRALGIQRFVFYNFSILSPDIDKVLDYYQQAGVAEVLDWHYPKAMKRSAYFNQFEAIQDCLYRSLQTTRYVLFGDLDEITMPRSTPDLLTLLNELFTEQPQCGAFRFFNTFFQPDPHSTPSPQPHPPPPAPKAGSSRAGPARNRPQASPVKNSKKHQRPSQTDHAEDELPPRTDPDVVLSHAGKPGRGHSNLRGAGLVKNSALRRSGSSLGESDEDDPHEPMSPAEQENFLRQHGLNMLLIRERVNEVWVNGKRAKLAVIPSRVEAGSVHTVEALRGQYTLCAVPPERGLLHHYRKGVPDELGVKHLGQDRGYVSDHTLYKLADRVIPGIRRVLTRLNLSNMGSD